MLGYIVYNKWGLRVVSENDQDDLGGVVLSNESREFWGMRVEGKTYPCIP